MLTTSRYVNLVEDNISNNLETIEMYNDKLSNTEDPNIKTLVMLCNGISNLKETIQMRSINEQIKIYEQLFY